MPRRAAGRAPPERLRVYGGSPRSTRSAAAREDAKRRGRGLRAAGDPRPAVRLPSSSSPDLVRSFAPSEERQAGRLPGPSLAIPGDSVLGRPAAALARHLPATGSRPGAREPNARRVPALVPALRLPPLGLLAGFLLVGLAAALGLGRARRSGLRSAAFLFVGGDAACASGASPSRTCSWRYQLPQLVLLPPALALGLTALTRRRKRDEGRRARLRDRRTGP